MDGFRAKEMKLKFDIQNNRKGPMDAGTEVYGWLLFYVPKGHYKALWIWSPTLRLFEELRTKRLHRIQAAQHSEQQSAFVSRCFW